MCTTIYGYVFIVYGYKRSGHIDIYIYISIKMTAFISQDVFETSVEERKAEEEVTPWKSLPRKVIMKIVLIERCKSTLYGECFLLHLEHSKVIVPGVQLP